MAVSYGKAAKGKATRLHASLVRKRGACERCGNDNPGKLQCAHIISRTFSATRCLLENAWCLCASCHFRLDTHPDEKMAFAAETIGMSEYWRLKTLALSSPKMDWPAEVERLEQVSV